MMTSCNRMMLGSAQFGMNYGIANRHGQVSQQEVANILQLAETLQIDMIDTASQYGASEEILGSLANQHFKIITKLKPLPTDCDHLKPLVLEQCQASLKRLQRPSCAGILVHHAQDLLGEKGESLYEALLELKSAKLVNKIGVSVYSVSEVEALLTRFTVDIIQFPVNLLDQRFLQHDLLKNLKANNIELHARSLFLQGLLLMNPDALPPYFANVKPRLMDLHADCKARGISIRRALIQFASSIQEIDRYIVGIDNQQQLSEIAADFALTQCNKNMAWDEYSYHDPAIINPTYWHRVKT